MALTIAQLAALKADILAAFPGVPNTDDQNFAIANAYNLLAAPAYTVWKSTLDVPSILDVLEYPAFIARSVGERDAFRVMLLIGFINPSRPNIRQGLNDIFSGPSGASQRASLLAIAKRFAARAEKLFATGTGSDALPATMGFEGNLSFADVSQARNS